MKFSGVNVELITHYDVEFCICKVRFGSDNNIIPAVGKFILEKMWFDHWIIYLRKNNIIIAQQIAPQKDLKKASNAMVSITSMVSIIVAEGTTSTPNDTDHHTQNDHGVFKRR